MTLQANPRLQESHDFEYGYNAVLRSTLLIVDTDHMADRGLYKCAATNDKGTNHSVIYLRVRNRYAFLFPLGGIILELIIVIVIILLLP